MEEEESFAWDALVPCAIHPMKVLIIEAMGWISIPLSAADLSKIIDDKQYGTPRVSYHMVTLAKAGVIEVVRTRQVRGAIEKFYFFL